MSEATCPSPSSACAAAEAAFAAYSATPREDRARFLDAIAEEIDARGPAITQIGTQETGLPAATSVAAPSGRP